MPRGANQLQVRTIEAARPRARDYYLNDGNRLALRVYPSGKKTFVYRYELDGRMRRVEHAKPFGKGPGTLSLAEARAWRSELDELRAHGIDPVAATLAQRHQLRRAVAAAAPHGAPPGAAPIDYPLGTFGAIANEFYARVIARQYRRPQGARRMLDADLLPHLGARPLASITLRDVQAVLNAIVDRGAPVQANRVLLLAKRVLRYARMQGHIEVNPIAELTRRDVGGTEGERERALSLDEIAGFWRVLVGAVPVKRPVRGFARKDGRTVVAPYARGGLHIEPATRACLQMLLLTGQRVGETLLARWGDIDLERCEWRIPAQNTKTGRAHLVHLPSLAVDVLRALPGRRGAEDFVFASAQSARPAPLERRTVTRALDRLLASGALPIEHFTPHDLRRTLRTRLGDLGVLPHVAEKILNHRLGGVLQVYDRSDYLAERAAAMALWDATLRALLADASGRVAVAPSPPRPARGKAVRTAVAAAVVPKTSIRNGGSNES
jgi:integrase